MAFTPYSYNIFLYICLFASYSFFLALASFFYFLRFARSLFISQTCIVRSLMHSGCSILLMVLNVSSRPIFEMNIVKILSRYLRPKREHSCFMQWCLLTSWKLYSPKQIITKLIFSLVQFRRSQVTGHPASAFWTTANILCSISHGNSQIFQMSSRIFTSTTANQPAPKSGLQAAGWLKNCSSIILWSQPPTKEGLLGLMQSLMVLMRVSMGRVSEIWKRSWDRDLADRSCILALESLYARH